MGITVAWQDEQETIIRMNYRGFWTNEDFHDAGVRAIMMARSRTDPIYVVSDYTESETAPLGVLWQARDLSQMRPSNWAGGVTVTQDMFLKSLLEIFVHIYMLRHHQRNQFLAASSDEALEIIARLKKEIRVS